MKTRSIKLYLIRHGEAHINVNPHLVSGRSNDSPLTEYGAEQSRLLGYHLRTKGITPSKVYSSPAVRAKQTATHMLQAMNLNVMPVMLDDMLQELDQGDWVGRPRQEVYSADVLTAIERQGKNFKAPNGESMNEVGMRMLDWANRIASDTQSEHNERIFAFTHGIAIRCLASTLYDWARLKTYETATDNVSISLFMYQAGRWEMKNFAVRAELLS